MNFFVKITFSYVAALYWIGVLSGYYNSHGPWDNWNPDTYIHGALHSASFLLGVRFIWNWGARAWRAGGTKA